jgi:sporulation protein YlmC with PRC-barrel domain
MLRFDRSLKPEVLPMSSYRMSSLLGRKVHASDGEVGTLHDIYFSDDAWLVEHMIVQTGTYFRRRRLLVPPQLIVLDEDRPDVPKITDVFVNATCEEILASREYTDAPSVSDQRAIDPRLHPYFLWFPKVEAAKTVLRPMGAGEKDLEVNEAEVRGRGHNPHLQSFLEVRGYAVYKSGADIAEEADELIGHVQEFVVSSANQHIQQVLIDTVDGSKNETMIVEPQDIEEINWANVHLYLRRTHDESGAAL